jgi:hypothetical protein
MKNIWTRIKNIKWTGTLIVAAVALLLSGMLGGFYISDTLQGRGTSLGSVLKIVGFCPTPSGAGSATPVAGPKGDKGDKGDTGAPGKDATATPAPAPVTSAGPAGTKGTPGASGAPGPSGSPGTSGTNGTNGTKGTNGTNGTNGVDGVAGTCTALDTSALPGDIVPSLDNTYSLGTLQKRWKDLQLGPGTLYIQDTETGQQAGITISNGTLLLDGVDGLRIGNVRFTSTGITSLLAGQDITIGSLGDQGWMSVAHGIKFSDGTTMTSAASLVGPAGPTGPTGPRGLTGATGPAGPQGPQGPPGSIEANGYVETKACMYTGRPNNIPAGTVMIGTCASLSVEGKDIQILVK